jgi:MFS transporter, PPP family, 3-phenylpropionic acid transporter
MSPSLTSLTARLSGLHATTFLGIGVYLPFFPVWLQAKALSPSMIGVVVAIPVVVRILVTAPLLALADRSFGARRLLLASHIGQLIGYPALAFLNNEFLIAGMVAVLAVAHSAVVPANDLVVLGAVRQHPGLNYGLMRSSGSITFLAASIGAGYLVDFLGVAAVPWALASLPILALVAVQLALPTAAGRVVAMGEPGNHLRTGRLPRALWLVMAAFACTQASHAGVYTFGSIHWRALGYSDSTIGYLWGIGVLVEIGIFLVLGKSVGRGSGAFWLLAAGAVAVVVRFAVLATDPHLAVAFAMQALHGLTFAASHLGVMAALAALAPDEARGRAQGLLGSISALALAVATVASGVIYRGAGSAVFAAMAAFGVAALVLILMAVRALRSQPQRAGEGG